MGSNDGSQRGMDRRASFAQSLDVRSVHKEARRDWMFRKTGVQEYRGRLKPYTHGTASVGRASVDSDSTETPRSRTMNSRRGSLWAGTVDTEMSSPFRSFTGLNALCGSNVLSSWQDLSSAPLFEDSLVDPTPHFLDALQMLINAFRNTVDDDVTGEQLRLARITQKSVAKLSDTTCPAGIRKKCKAILEAVEVFGWCDSVFRPPLILPDADRLRSTLLEKMGDGDDAGSDASLPVQDPRNEFINSEQMTWWQNAQADIWELLMPSASFECSARLAVTILQVIVLIGWAVFYCVSTLPQYYCASGSTQRVLDALEASFAVYYTLEAVLKIFVSPAPEAQLRKPLFMIELVALVPFYVRTCWRWAGGDWCTTTGVVGHINMFTVLRVLKVTAYMGEHLEKLTSVVRASAYTLSLGACLLVLCVLLMSNVMYYVEMESGVGGYDFVEGVNRSFWVRNEQPALVVNITGNITTMHNKVLSPFQSQVDFYWWCIATLTTVGYGDATPTTAGGRIVAGLCMVVGVLVFAVPASVICSHFTLSKNEALLRTERNERSEIRDYVREICLRSNDSFAQVMLHHFVMLDVVELHHMHNPAMGDLASEIYQRILWIYKSCRYAEQIMLAECEQRVERNREAEGDFVPIGALSSNAADICKKRFADNCAEVFRTERTRLWEAYANIKKDEAMQGP